MLIPSVFQKNIKAFWQSSKKEPDKKPHSVGTPHEALCLPCSNVYVRFSILFMIRIVHHRCPSDAKRFSFSGIPNIWVSSLLQANPETHSLPESGATDGRSEILRIRCILKDVLGLRSRIETCNNASIFAKPCHSFFFS